MGFICDDAIIFKLLLTGDSTVGKSSFLNRYINDNFSKEFYSTIGVDFFVRHITKNGYKIKLQLWDTAGQEKFRSISSSYYRGSDCIVLCYDITNRESFHSLSYWLDLINTNAKDNVVIVIIGLKKDLDGNRMVSVKEAKQFSKQYGEYYEFSSKDQTANDISDIIIDKVLDKLLKDNDLEVKRICKINKDDEKKDDKCCL